MKLFRIAILGAAALALVACSQATSSKKSGGTATPTPTPSTNIENFQEYSTNTALTADWTVSYATSTVVTPSVALATGSSALGGTASMTMSYGQGGSESYKLADFSVTSAAATSKLFTNSKANYTADMTGVSVTFNSSNYDALRVIFRKTGNIDVYVGLIDTPDVTAGTTQTVKIPFSAFTTPGYSTSDGLVSSLAAGLSAGAFDNFTIECECDDASAAAGVTRTVKVQSIQYY